MHTDRVDAYRQSRMVDEELELPSREFLDLYCQMSQAEHL